ncbi:MAG: substrate-binding domain-containing protein [Lachnospiraceae bacterium]|nr:substrate-binding domain-containing protein [Lachnospiraceae bacterium]
MEQISRMTLEEIAKEIGISRTTIYKVIKNKGHVSEETSRIVNEALKKYNYVQNRNARNLAMNRHYTIGYVGFKSKSANYFSTEIGKGIKRAVKEFGDDGLSVLVSEYDAEKPRGQLAAVKEMLFQGIDSFVLAYSDKEIIEQILKLLGKAGAGIVLLSRDYQEDKNSYYVGVDYYKSGRLAAELLGKMLSGGKILIPVTEEYETNPDIVARLDGFLDKIKEYPYIKLLPVSYGLTEENKIYREIDNCIKNEPELTGIFDLTYRLDVIAKLLGDKNRKDIKLVGFDLFEEIRSYVEDSSIDAVVYQDLSMQAYQAVKILFNEMCYGKSMEQRKLYSKLEIIMNENIHYF